MPVTDMWSTIDPSARLNQPGRAKAPLLVVGEEGIARRYLRTMNCDRKISTPIKTNRMPIACLALGETIGILFMSGAFSCRVPMMIMSPPMAHNAIVRDV